MSTSSRVATLAVPSGGWTHPWPNVFELAAALPTHEWTLVGGLMVQVHALAHGVNVVRPTEDLDLLLHIELSTAVVSRADHAISGLNYSLQEPGDVRRTSSPHYRYVRRAEAGRESIDVMVPDHAPPRAIRRLRGRPMFAVEGGTQALSRTMVYILDDGEGRVIRLSVPDELGALVLKGAAYSVDRRDRDRHLEDAAVLAACINDHASEIDRLGGSDRRRLRLLAKALADSAHPAWLALDRQFRVAGQDTLRILTD